MGVGTGDTYCLSEGVVHLVHVLVEEGLVKDAMRNTEADVFDIHAECELPSKCPECWQVLLI